MTTWILRLILVVLPVAVALYWISLRRRHSSDTSVIRTREIQLAIVFGVLIVSLFAVLFFVSPGDAGKNGDFYVAPHEVNGKVVPGEFISREEAKARGLLRDTPALEDETLDTFGD